jgi:hypothetical protein
MTAMAVFEVKYQTPRPKVEIIPPNNDGSRIMLVPDLSGVSENGKSITSRNLLSYAFSEAVDDLEGSFSFSVENEMIKPAANNDGKSLFDHIPLRSVVNIYEDDEGTPVFCGIIRKRHTGATMTANGVKKSAVFSGKSIISCITEFVVSLDVRIPNVSNATSKTKDLQEELGKNDMTITSFMKKTWEYFREVSDEVSRGSGITNGRLLQIIDNYIGEDYIEVTGSETTLQYPVATMFYNQTANYITDVWRNILPKPAYELFTRFDEKKKKPVIIARQTPYGGPDNGKDWLDLELYPINPVLLTGYDLEQSDEDVYTAFNSYIIGSPKSKEFYEAASYSVGTEMEINEDKSAIYGFRPLSVSFMGYDRMKNQDAAEQKNELNEALSKLDLKTKYWFSRLDEMYSGTIMLITSFKRKKDGNGNYSSENPRAGCRVSFLGGQFYVEKSEHSWNYGRTPVNRLTVSRGMVYDANGKIENEIPGIGKLYGERNG